MRILGVNPGEDPDYIVVGLGNPGPRYQQTRHNIGFDVIDYIDQNGKFGTGCKRHLHSALVGKCVVDGAVFFLVKPQTFMNNSGMAVADVMQYYRKSPANLIVIHDDITLDAGKFKIKFGGSAGGHNGIKSIIEHIKTTDFTRIKVGIGKKPEGWDLADHVLAKIPNEEYKMMTSRFKYIQMAASCVARYGKEHAMGIYNKIGADINFDGVINEKYT